MSLEVEALTKQKKRVHDELKQWLLDLGKKSGYDHTYSGDSEPIDIRIKKKHVEYNPDVVWNHKGNLYIIEIAFSEDWRAIAGEFLLVSMIRNCKGFLIITEGDPDFTNDLFHLMDKQLDLPYWISYTFEPKDLKNVDNVKRKIKSWLTKNSWI